ncbi:MAG TPA: hypothetical protein VKT99_02410 [Xanthobacteraceae bacterium]|jgi:hypothetical protein|nr:hypothetical protein [Xanthobacteraceae bacterium]
MTAQAPERIITDGRPRALYADPLYPLLQSHGLDLSNPHCRSTGNYRGYIGTWQIRGRTLFLLHLNWMGYENGTCEVPIPDETLTKLLCAIPCARLPTPARWFNGVLRIAVGRRLIYSHHGWSHWFERERVIRVKAGEIIRDREVDTRSILDWALRRYPGMQWLQDEDGERHESSPLAPLIWRDTSADDDWEADWWPPDFPRHVLGAGEE